ncbi:LutB/LldF family L-lactate oxidation iron-sulfur protein [Desulfovibrio inopinatus]|uniref:LutB/LldF family L-lactate oxidation iron-sulfur protein n=1 Tax=Desulfovibrio inopinatus TaxID=102109 RepID=UPI00040EB2D5|nr:LutB/LldF family L-lactate oxidation iron-sulfur protein [Desulfovibrio inopinatus]
MTEIKTEHFKQAASSALNDEHLHGALRNLQNRIGKGALASYKTLPEGEGLRQVGRTIRRRTIAQLDHVLETLAANVEKRGGHVFFAQDAAEATAYCRRVAQKHQVKRVVKGKSMLSEEIGLNPALEEDGIEVVETDLGEYIIQLAGDSPSHIIAPAIHMTRQDIGRLFEEKLGTPYTEDPPELTLIARKTLREKFLHADMGISGGNIACAETGQVALVSNEGNIRMASTLPKVHIALIGMEKVAATLYDHHVVLRLLTRGAAAQNMSTYVSYVGGPRGNDEADGPEEFHLVIVDNGRMRILADPEFREILHCIKCGGCLNICPVYAKVGGHSYGFPYCGPIGTVAAPLLSGVNRAKDLIFGETLCGACRDICPVGNDLPRMILALRFKLAQGDQAWDVTPTSQGERLGYAAWAGLVRSHTGFTLAAKAAGAGQRLLPQKDGAISTLPPPLNGWTFGRDIRLLAKDPFSVRFRRMRATSCCRPNAEPNTKEENRD